MDKLHFDEFKANTKEEWLDSAIKSLKGQAIEDFNLVDKGLEIQPYYHYNHYQHFVSFSKSNNDWYIHQEIIAENTLQKNKKALEVLNSGVNAITFQNEGDFHVLLNDILVSYIQVLFKIKTLDNDYLISLNQYFKKNKIDSTQLIGGIFSNNGHLAFFENNQTTFIQQLITIFPKYKCIAIQATSNNDSVQELAELLAIGNEYIEFYKNDIQHISALANTIQFELKMTGSYFVDIARLRALRLLWQTVVHSHDSSITSVNTNIHALVDTTVSEKEDYTNLLRLTTKAMSAGIAGADIISILPFDGNANDFSERMARNIQLILKHESFLDKVVDPSSGSYAIDSLTQQLMDKSWMVFQEIEKKGGYLKNQTLKIKTNE
jgi:methylmalonyl-CoA mutase